MRLRTLLLGFMLAALSGCAAGTAVTPSRAGSSANDVILVFGASGRTGQYIIRQLAAEGRNFKAVTSNVERARGKLGATYPWVQADVRDAKSLEPLFREATTVISSPW